MKKTSINMNSNNIKNSPLIVGVGNEHNDLSINKKIITKNFYYPDEKNKKKTRK